MTVNNFTVDTATLLTPVKAELWAISVSGIARKFFRGEQKEEVWGQKSPSGVQ